MSRFYYYVLYIAALPNAVELDALQQRRPSAFIVA